MNMSRFFWMAADVDRDFLPELPSFEYLSFLPSMAPPDMHCVAVILLGSMG